MTCLNYIQCDIIYNDENFSLGYIEDYEKMLFEDCGYFEENIKPYIDININNEIKRCYFEFICSPQLMLHITLFCRFAITCGSANVFKNSLEKNKYIKKILNALVPYPDDVEYDDMFYKEITNEYYNYFNFDLGYHEGVGRLFQDLIKPLNVLHPMHKDNLIKYLLGIKNLYEDRLDLICSKLNIKNIFNEDIADITDNTINIPLCNPLIKDTYTLSGLKLTFCPSMIINNEIGYELTGILNGIDTKLSIRGLATDYNSFFKLVKILQNDIISSPIDFMGEQKNNF